MINTFAESIMEFRQVLSHLINEYKNQSYKLTAFQHLLVTGSNSNRKISRDKKHLQGMMLPELKIQDTKFSSTHQLLFFVQQSWRVPIAEELEQ